MLQSIFVLNYEVSDHDVMDSSENSKAPLYNYSEEFDEPKPASKDLAVTEDVGKNVKRSDLADLMSVTFWERNFKKGTDVSS